MIRRETQSGTAGKLRLPHSMKSYTHILLACLSLALFQCNEKINDNPATNKPPKTFLWLYPDSSVGVGVSRQHLRWWGEDPDGIVRGYLFGFLPFRISGMPSPDTVRYVWVTKNDTVMQFPLDTLFRYYTVFVRSVDNSFAGLPEQTVVRLSRSPFADKNDNGIFDAGDVSLPTLSSAMDPAGASLVFPIRNTPPRIGFLPNPNDATAGFRLPDYTYTVVSIGFKGTDDDGETNLAGYRIALNDTSNQANWLSVRLRDTIITLVVPRARSDAAPPIPGTEVAADVYSGKFNGGQMVGQLPGLRLDATNVFYVQAKDVAGEFSPVIRMPAATQPSWFVRRPRGKVLMVEDYTRLDQADAVNAYLTAFRQIPDPLFATIDTLNIALGINIANKQAGKLSRMVPPYIDPTLVRTFLLYDYVFLFTDEGPSLAVAQTVPFLYLQNGGKLLMSTIFTQNFTSILNPNAVLKEFAPIDSICSVTLGVPPPPAAGDTRLLGATPLLPDSSDPTNIYPRLALNGTSSTIHNNINMRPLYRRTDARYLYRLPKDTRVPARYTALRSTLNAAFSLNQQVAWLAGTGGVTLRSVDGGANWSETDITPARDLYDVWFADASRGIVVGTQGAIYRTLDGGATWSAQASGVSVDLRSVSFADANRGIAVGNSGRTLRTNDGGTTWTLAPSVTNGDLTSVSYSGTNAVAVGPNPTILRSVNDGAAWTSVSPGVPFPLKGVALSGTGIVLAVGDSLNVARILRSTDGGVTWSVRRNIAAPGLNSIIFTDPNTAYATGNSGTILRTTNAGVDWTSISPGGSGTLLDIAVSGQKAFVGGSGGIILTSDNGGGAWTYQTHGTIYVAVIDSRRTNVFFGLPLHLLNNTDSGNQGLAGLFTKMFHEAFSPVQRIDRRRF